MPEKHYYARPRIPVRGDRGAVPDEQFTRRSGGQDGVLDLKLTCVTPLHAGTGITGLEGGRAIMLTAREGETPVIPGSVLKGAFRLVAEAIARSCPDQRCRQCYPCLLFGSVGYRGRVTFASARPETSTRPLGFMLPLRTSRGPTRDDSSIRLYDHLKAQPDPRGIELVETLAAGTTLHCSLQYQGLEPAALGLFLLITGTVPGHAFLHKIGAAKSQGLGSVKVEVVAHRVRQVRHQVPPVEWTTAEAAPADLANAFLELEKHPEAKQALTETLTLLREKSRPLEVELP